MGSAISYQIPITQPNADALALYSTTTGSSVLEPMVSGCESITGYNTFTIPLDGVDPAVLTDSWSAHSSSAIHFGPSTNTQIYLISFNPALIEGSEYVVTVSFTQSPNTATQKLLTLESVYLDGVGAVLQIPLDDFMPTISTETIFQFHVESVWIVDPRVCAPETASPSSKTMKVTVTLPERLL